MDKHPGTEICFYLSLSIYVNYQTISFSCNLQPIALLMESVAAKDLACLLAGYCKLLVDPNINVFRWGPRPKMRRIPAEEGRRFGQNIHSNLLKKVL